MQSEDDMEQQGHTASGTNYPKTAATINRRKTSKLNAEMNQSDDQENEDSANGGKNLVDPELSSDYSTGLVGQSSLIHEYQDQYKLSSSKIAQANNYRHNRSLERHNLLMDQEKKQWLLEEAERLHQLDGYELPSEKYLN